MNKKIFNENLFEFIKNSTCSFTCIKTIKKELKALNYKELYENEHWNITEGNYFITRNDSSIITFSIGNNHNKSFNVICTHADTSGFTLKSNNEIYENNYLKLNVMPYGGILNYGWMDRPLSIAGRIIYKENNTYKKKIIDLKEPITIIPSEAIHQNELANTNLELNTQTDLIPIISLKNEKNIIKTLIKEHLKTNINIQDFDLFLYSKDEPTYIGKNKEMILSPRIDNLTCTFALVKSFTEINNEENINIMCIFNSEEIGSLTKEGADSSFLIDTLKKICSYLEIDIRITLANSIIVSADNTHAVHPNHKEKSDITNQAYLNKGILIIKEQETMTDSITSTIIKGICKKAKIPFQNYSSRNDMTSGSTFSGLSIRHVSTNSIDLGLPQLAMHSGNELIGSDDTHYLYKLFKEFYKTKIIFKKDKITLTNKD